MSATNSRPLFDPKLVRRAMWDALVKLDPRRMLKNPVMFVVEVGSAFTTLLAIHALSPGRGDTSGGSSGEGGCGCTQSRAGDGPAALLGLLALLGLRRRRA